MGSQSIRRSPVALAAAVTAVLVSSLLAPRGPVDAQTVDIDHGEFVSAAFEGLLDRTPDPAGERYWLDRFEAGEPPRTILESFGTTPEHHRVVVQRAYERFLGRDADAGGVAWWAERLGRSRSATALWAGLAGSGEYLRERGGGTPAGFIDALYGDVLGRDPDSAGVAHWLGRLGAGASRIQVAASVMGSPEAFRLSDLSVTSAAPAPGETVSSLDGVELTIGNELVTDASTVLVSVAGRRVTGTVEGSGTTLRFVPDEVPTWAPLGERTDVVVTAFGYDGSTLARADYSFTLRRTATPGRTDGELPRGGHRLFPDHLLVAFYGGSASPALGVLGQGTPAEAGRRLLEQVAPYESLTDREVLPVFELIATLATSAPGPEGHYSAPTAPGDIEPYLEAVRELQGLLLLDLQPGRAEFIDEARRYEQFLVQADVGLALDPEWKVGPTGRPGGGHIGTIDAAQINEVSAYLAALVTDHDLPEKLLVVHRFTPGMVTNVDQILDREGVAIVVHADGFGSPEAKLADYHGLLPDRFVKGMKIFYQQDSRIMTPGELLGLSPPPGFVSYQ